MKKINQRNYFVVIDDSEEMWTAVKFTIKRAKSTKSNLTTISFIESIIWCALNNHSFFSFIRAF